jgi:O-antigen ligase
VKKENPVLVADERGEAAGAIAGPHEPLVNNMWPRSLAFWMTAIYLALFIVRPWERIQWLAALHFERIYAICMVVVVFLTSRNRLQARFQSVSVVLFLLAVGVSGLCGVNPTASWEPFYQYLSLVIFYFVLVLSVRTPYQLTFMVGCYIVTMSLYLAKSEWEYFVHGAHRMRMNVSRLEGIDTAFGGPNFLAMSVVVSLPFLLYLWSVRKQFTCRWPGLYRYLFPKMLLAYLALGLSSVILTNSRSGFLGLVCFALLVAFRGRGFLRKVGYCVLAAVALLLVWNFIPDESRGRLRTIWDPESGPASAQKSTEGRLEGFRAGMTMFRRFPATGVGIGNFIEYRMGNVDGGNLEAHNLVGQMLGETGFLGGLAFFLMVAATVGNCRRTRRRGAALDLPPVRALSALALASLTSMVLLFLEGFSNHNLLRFNWIWLAAFGCIAIQYCEALWGREPAARLQPAAGIPEAVLE